MCGCGFHGYTSFSFLGQLSRKCPLKELNLKFIDQKSASRGKSEDAYQLLLQNEADYEVERQCYEYLPGSTQMHIQHLFHSSIPQACNLLSLLDEIICTYCMSCFIRALLFLKDIEFGNGVRIGSDRLGDNELPLRIFSSRQSGRLPVEFLVTFNLIPSLEIKVL